MLCANEHNCPSGPGGTCCGEPYTEKVTYAGVSSLSLLCGCCGMGIEIENDDLDSDEGKIQPWAMFGECAECGAMYDASSVTFQVLTKERSDG